MEEQNQTSYQTSQRAKERTSLHRRKGTLDRNLNLYTEMKSTQNGKYLGKY